MITEEDRDPAPGGPVQPQYVPDVPESGPRFRTGLLIPLATSILSHAILVPLNWNDREYYSLLMALFVSGALQIFLILVLLVVALFQRQKAFAKGVAAGGGLAILINFVVCVSGG